MLQRMVIPVGSNSTPTQLINSGNFPGGAGNSLTFTGLEASKKYLVVIGGAGSTVANAETYVNSVTISSGGSLEDIQVISGQLGSGMYTSIRTCFITTSASSITLSSSQTGASRNMPVSVFNAN